MNNMNSKSTTSLLLGCAILAFSSRALPVDPEPHGGFVTAEGTRLKLNGGDYYFSGANSYSILYSEFEAEEQFRIASELGLNVLRIWGFWNGEVLEPQLDENGNIVRPATPDTDIYGHYVLQSRPWVYPEQGWRRLDYAIYLAHVYNMKLIIPLLNEWPEFGGLETYMDWVGIELPPKPDGHYAWENLIKAMRDEFWLSEEAKELYLDYVTYALNRVNTYTGIAYKDDPAIMIWELLNEPRYGPWNGNTDATVVRDWLADAAAHIKSIDSNHLVGTGEEGFLNLEDNDLGRETYPWDGAAGEGVSFVLNGEIPDIDVLGFHCWPFQWNLWGSSEQDLNEDTEHEYPDLTRFTPEWITEHVRLAAEAGKPVYLGEFGFQILRQPGSDLSVRDAHMKAAYDTAREVDIAGMAYFHITASHDPRAAVYTGPMERKTLVQAQYYDGIMPHDVDFRFDVYCPEDESTCDIIRKFTEYMTDKVENPDPEFAPPCLDPKQWCDGACIIVDSHPDHCGECGFVCEDEETCRDGECVPLADEQEDGADSEDAGGCQAAGAVGRSRIRFGVLLNALIPRLGSDVSVPPLKKGVRGNSPVELSSLNETNSPRPPFSRGSTSPLKKH